MGTTGTKIKNGIVNILYPKKSIRDQFKDNTLLIGIETNTSMNELNATLQCLCHIEPLVNYIKYEFGKIKERIIFKSYEQSGNCLTQSFKDLIEELWPDGLVQTEVPEANKYTNTAKSDKISDMIRKINPSYNENQHILIEIILTRLNQELNKAEKNEVDNNLIDTPTYKEPALKNFQEKFEKENKSKIGDFFYWTYCTNTKCKDCGKDYYQFSSCLYLFNSFVELYQYKRQNNNNNFEVKMINVLDCLEFSQKNQIQQPCTSCFNKRSCEIRKYIFCSPKILIFVFNKNIQMPNGINFFYTETISIKNFVEIKKQEEFIYDLIGIIIYTSQNGYIAFCNNPSNSKWYCYQDKQVTPVDSLDKIKSYNYSPYILIYQKMKENN